MPRKTDVTIEEILEKQAEGLGPVAIGKALGVSQSFVSRQLEKYRASQAASATSIQLIPRHQIEANPWQPRFLKGIEALMGANTAGLVDRIRKSGLIYAPTGRRIAPNKVQICVGHRRMASLWTLADQGDCFVVNSLDRLVDGAQEGFPVEIHDYADLQMKTLALEENEEREGLTPLEVVVGYQRILDTTDGMTVVELASEVGRDRSVVANELRVLKLPRVVLERVESGDLSFRAARELLVWQNDDHCHEEEMAWVINSIARTGGSSGAPDWRPDHVRKVMNQLVYYNDSLWRPLEPHNLGEMDYQQRGSKNARRTPSFEVQPFHMLYPHLVHHVPDATGSGSKIWTCGVTAWQRLQTQATREANKALAAADAEALAPYTDEEGNIDERAARVAGVAPQVVERAANPKPVKGAMDNPLVRSLQRDPLLTALKGKPAVSKKEIENLSDEEKEALGSRLSMLRKDEYNRWRAPLEDAPCFLARQEECQNQCNWGAKYAADYSHRDLHLACSNKSCFEQKLAEGKPAWEAAQQEVRQQHQEQAVALASERAAKWDVDTVGSTLKLVTAHRDCRNGRIPKRTPDTGDRHTDVEWSYYPQYLLDAFAQVGVKPQKLDSWSDAELLSLESVPPLEPESLRYLAATLSVYLNGEDIAELPAGEAAEPEAVLV